MSDGAGEAQGPGGERRMTEAVAASSVSGRPASP